MTKVGKPYGYEVRFFSRLSASLEIFKTFSLISVLSAKAGKTPFLFLDYSNYILKVFRFS